MNLCLSSFGGGRRGKAQLRPRTKQPNATMNRPHHRFRFIPRLFCVWEAGPRMLYSTRMVPKIRTTAAM